MSGIELYAARSPRHRRTWTIAALLLAIVFIIGGQLIGTVPGIMLGLISVESPSADWASLAAQLLAFIPITLLVVGWVVLFERRGLATIGFNGEGLKRFWRGYGLGLAFILAVVGIIAACGGYRIEAGGAFTQASVWRAIVPILVLLLGFIIQGSTEEIVTRGWLMQVIASRHGLGLAIGLTATLFGLLHVANAEPSPTLALGVVNIVLAGVFLGLYAAREGSLWGVCGWHAAWNWLLGLGFGLEVSGQAIDTPPLIVDLAVKSELPWWLTGAGFGPEASVAATAVLFVGSLLLFLRGRSEDYGQSGPVYSSTSLL